MLRIFCTKNTKRIFRTLSSRANDIPTPFSKHAGDDQLHFRTRPGSNLFGPGNRVSGCVWVPVIYSTDELVGGVSVQELKNFGDCVKRARLRRRWRYPRGIRSLMRSRAG